MCNSLRNMKSLAIIFVSILTLVSCATIVNDPNTPVTLSFSDASSGTCNLSNKRGSWSGKVPGTFSIRRSDDNLSYRCTTDTGKTGFGNIASSIEGAKLGASVLFFDFGITDAITDKHRTYSTSFVIPVE